MAEIAPAIAEREKTLLRLPPCPDNYRAWPGHHLVTLAARVDPGWQTVVAHRANRNSRHGPGEPSCRKNPWSLRNCSFLLLRNRGCMPKAKNATLTSLALDCRPFDQQSPASCDCRRDLRRRRHSDAGLSHGKRSA